MLASLYPHTDDNNFSREARGSGTFREYLGRFQGDMMFKSLLVWGREHLRVVHGPASLAIVAFPVSLHVKHDDLLYRSHVLS